jgi:AcrR family transcriptional regulator
MPEIAEETVKLTKGERTAQRILDVAEELFAERGYDGTSLRQIADRAGIKQPGLYNHFAGKQALYEAVLFRALNPIFAMKPWQGALPTLYAATAPDVKGGDYYGPGGFQEMRGYPSKVVSIPESHDENMAARLWQTSEQLTGVTYEAP